MSVGHEKGPRSQAGALSRAPGPLGYGQGSARSPPAQGTERASSPGVNSEGHSGGRRKEQKVPRTEWPQAGDHILSSFPNLSWGSS